MKVVALVSGGKDSCYAMMRCTDFGHEVVNSRNSLLIIYLIVSSSVFLKFLRADCCIGEFDAVGGFC